MLDNVKFILRIRDNDLHFVNQMNIVNKDGVINNWIHSSFDLYTND